MADEVRGDAQASSLENAAPHRRGLFRLIKVVAFVSVVVIVEIVVAAIIAPTAQETERLAKELAAASHGHEAGSDDHSEEHAHGSSHDLREVALGTFNVTRFNPASNTTLAIDFELYGTVLADDVGEFEHLYENSKARIREQVTMTLHGADSSNLTDAGLGLIKRQILEKTNRALGEPMLKEVLFSKFNFVER